MQGKPTQTQIDWMRAVARDPSHWWPKGSIWDDRQECIDRGWLMDDGYSPDHRRFQVTPTGRAVLSASNHGE